MKPKRLGKYERAVHHLMIKRDSFLEVSPFEADGGQKVGKLPGSIGLEQLRSLGHSESSIRAIRSKCLDCCAGAASEVRKCVAITCSLWPLRMGVNPFHGRREPSAPVSTDNRESGEAKGPLLLDEDANGSKG